MILSWRSLAPSKTAINLLMLTGMISQASTTCLVVEGSLSAPCRMTFPLESWFTSWNKKADYVISREDSHQKQEV